MESNSITWRELSAKSFSESGWLDPKAKIPPSKILDKLVPEFEGIIEHYYSSSVEEFGMISAKDILLIAGNLMRNNTNQYPRIFPDVLSFFHLTDTQSIMTKAKYLYLIENLSPFIQCAEKLNNSQKDSAFFIYIGGMPTFVQIKLIQMICNKNNFERIIIWVDHDFGGLRIANFLLEKLNNHEGIIDFWLIPRNIHYTPYRKLSIDTIHNEIKGKHTLIQRFGESILSNGEYEQELFINEFLSELSMQKLF